MNAKTLDTINNGPLFTIVSFSGPFLFRGVPFLSRSCYFFFFITRTCFKIASLVANDSLLHFCCLALLRHLLTAFTLTPCPFFLPLRAKLCRILSNWIRLRKYIYLTVACSLFFALSLSLSLPRGLSVILFTSELNKELHKEWLFVVFVARPYSQFAAKFSYTRFTLWNIFCIKQQSTAIFFFLASVFSFVRLSTWQ